MNSAKFGQMLGHVSQYYIPITLKSAEKKVVMMNLPTFALIDNEGWAQTTKISKL